MLSQAYRWFCRLAPGDKVPHHSTFSKNRHGRFRDAGVFRTLFESTVRRCIGEGLVGGKNAAIDASFIEADAFWQRKTVPGYLLYVANAGRPVREWLRDQGGAAAKPSGSKDFDGVSRTDPAAAWSARPGRARFGYALNALVDTPSGVALDVEATPARFAEEVDAGRVMLERSADRFDYHPKRVAADKAYGSAGFLGFVRDHGAIPHIPVIVSLVERIASRARELPIIVHGFAGERHPGLIDLLQAGADHVLNYDPDSGEAIARVQNTLRRIRRCEDTETVSHGTLVLDARQLSAWNNGVRLPLAVSEFRLLQCLAKAAPGVVNRHALRGHPSEPLKSADDMLNARIKRVRDALAATGGASI